MEVATSGLGTQTGRGRFGALGKASEKEWPVTWAFAQKRDQTSPAMYLFSSLLLILVSL